MHLVLPGITKVLLVRSLEGVAVAPVSLTFRADSLHSTLKVSSEDRDADDDQLTLTHSEGLSRYKADQPNPSRIHRLKVDFIFLSAPKSLLSAPTLAKMNIGVPSCLGP